MTDEDLLNDLISDLDDAKEAITTIANELDNVESVESVDEFLASMIEAESQAKKVLIEIKVLIKASKKR